MSSDVLTKSNYQELMQNPRVYLTDPDLQKFQVEKDPNGIPRVRSGGLALTYQLFDSNKKLALRCFHKVSPRREQHYSAISSFLSSHPSSLFVRTAYQPHGILYKGGYFPITIMDWIEGDTLGTFVFKNFNNKKVMSELTDKFLKLVNELIHLQVGHGDLSHSNLMVTKGNLILIDYDGMYVPKLTGKLSVELGNRSFQHPGRSEKDFGPEIDRFSAIVIYLALKSISISPTIYQTYGTGREGLLFDQSDFLDPDSSNLLDDMEKSIELKEQIRVFKRICKSDVSYVPTLEEFIKNTTATMSLPKSTTLRPLSTSSFPLDARRMGELLERDTENVVVIGKIGSFHTGLTIKGEPYVLLNIGVFPRHTFTVVIWSETLRLLENAGVNPIEFKNLIVSVSGVMSKYDGKPQIVLESPADIAVISVEDAKGRLNRNAIKGLEVEEATSIPITIPEKLAPEKALSSFTPSIPQQKDNSEVLNRLYSANGVFGNQPIMPPSSISQKLTSSIGTPSGNKKIPQGSNIKTNLPEIGMNSLRLNPTKDKDIWQKMIEWIKSQL